MDVTCPNATPSGSKVEWTDWAIWSGFQPHPRSLQMLCAIEIMSGSAAGGQVKPRACS